MHRSCIVWSILAAFDLQWLLFLHAIMVEPEILFMCQTFVSPAIKDARVLRSLSLTFCWPFIIVYQYSKTNVMQFLFSLLIIKGLYMLRALLAHLQEALYSTNDTLYIACVLCQLAATGSKWNLIINKLNKKCIIWCTLVLLYWCLLVQTSHARNHRRRLRVASGATVPGPALEGAPRFRPKVVLMSRSSYILR
jgi:hypothetical protein